MAAPVKTARTVPTGTKLENSFKATVAFALNAGVNLWEKAVQPPSIDGGDAIVTTTMLNVKYHTKAPRVLIDHGPVSMTCAYDPSVVEDIENLINQPGSITIHWPDGSALSFFGYLKSFAPQGLNGDGNFPEANVEIVVTNYDPVNHVESGPVYAAPVGT